MMKITKETDEYGFKNITVTTETGGRVSITNYGKESDTDIGGTSIVNEYGLGSRSWIRNIKDIDNHINEVKMITWIDEEEKNELVNFLKEF